MNSRLLKAKRVERGVTQKELAVVIGCSEKTMCKKEGSKVNLFTAPEMLKIYIALQLSLYEFDSIFFDLELTKHNIELTNTA